MCIDVLIELVDDCTRSRQIYCTLITLSITDELLESHKSVVKLKAKLKYTGFQNMCL